MKVFCIFEDFGYEGDKLLGIYDDSEVATKIVNELNKSHKEPQFFIKQVVINEELSSSEIEKIEFALKHLR